MQSQHDRLRRGAALRRWQSARIVQSSVRATEGEDERLRLLDVEGRQSPKLYVDLLFARLATVEKFDKNAKAQDDCLRRMIADAGREWSSLMEVHDD